MIQLGSTPWLDSQRVPPSPSTALLAAINWLLAKTGRPLETRFTAGVELLLDDELLTLDDILLDELGTTLELEELELGGTLEALELLDGTELDGTELALELDAQPLPTQAGALSLYAITRTLSKWKVPLVA